MSNAERQAAFRARRAAEGKTVTVTKNIPAVVDGYDELVRENDRLREELARVRRERKPVVDVSAGLGVLPVLDAVRQPVPDRQLLGRQRFGVTVDYASLCALKRLAVDAGLSTGVVVERLLYWADVGVLRSFGADTDAFNRYLDRKRNGKSGV
ncbi:hypothetical protein N0A02_26475 [Paraburkholderia acidicola]|uniref:Uncharacterized protein n=2 Tax=Paraburkholderia acidicola TaxID=1912599 RepID=A0ABV1LUQ8_9BURK